MLKTTTKTTSLSTTTTTITRHPFILLHGSTTTSRLYNTKEEEELLSSSSYNNIEFQSDASQYGRGEWHLSATLEEGDVVVYQTGVWLVDGVVVGAADKEEPSWEYARLETMQVVWTHNCEHGVLRGIRLELSSCPSSNDDTPTTTNTYCLRPVEPWQDVEFGPEQLVARIPDVRWDTNNNDTVGTCAIPLNNALWRNDYERRLES